MYYHYPSNNYNYLTSVNIDGVVTFYKNNKPIFINGNVLCINETDGITINIKNDEIIGIVITNCNTIKPDGIFSNSVACLEKTIKSHIRFFQFDSVSFLNVNFRSIPLYEIVSKYLKTQSIEPEYGSIVVLNVD